MKLKASWLIGLTLAMAGMCRADVMHLRTGPLPNITVVGMRDGEVVYVNPTGRETTKAMAEIQRLEIDSEPQFTAAEAAYAKADWEQATSGYERAIRTSNKPWLKQYAGVRLFETANKSGNFPAAVTAYLELVQSNPSLAAGKEPKLPDAGSTFLDTAAADVERVLGGRIEDAQRGPLLKFLLSIYQKQNDTAKVVATAERLARLTGDTAMGENQALLAGLKLSLAQVAFDKKDYATAQREIDAARAAFTEPANQSAALFLLARIAHAQAGDDRQKLADTAIAYMRVVAHFPESDEAGEALVKTAGILEQLGEKDKALDLYQQAAAEYPASKAGAEVERLKQNGG